MVDQTVVGHTGRLLEWEHPTDPGFSSPASRLPDLPPAVGAENVPVPEPEECPGKVPVRCTLAIGIDRGLVRMVSAVGSNDWVIVQQFRNSVPVIQQFVVHGISPVPRPEGIS